jgi:glyoxylase-like metal-dependent hydrolase (beta-lactamase superfamily II)
MAANTYRFLIGDDIEAVVIADESEVLPASDFDNIFNRDDADDIRKAFAQLESPMFGVNCLYLKTPTHRILVDTGSGQHPPQANGHLLEGLAEIGVKPEQIDIVFISHFHFDHIGGMFNDAGQLVFPNARLVTSRAEWNHWTREDFLATLDERRRNAIKTALFPYQQAGRLDLVDDDQEIAPGIRTVLLPGHTPGHSGLSIASGKAKLMHIVDTAHFPLQAEYIHSVPRFDFDAAQAISTRQAVFECIAENREMVLAYHFPFPGLGRMAQQGAVFCWEALVQK